MQIVYVDGVPTVIGPRGYKGDPGDMGLPGANGRDGRDAPTKEEILAALKADEDLKKSVIDMMEWDINIERDDNHFLKNIKVIPRVKEEN